MNGGNFDLGSIPPDVLSEAIAKISERPELITMVASALGKGADGSADTPTSSPASALPPPPSPSHTTPQSPNDLSSLIGSISPVMAALGGNRKKDPREEHRNALLCALKPYLSEDRRQMVDHIMKLSQISDILRIIK